MYKKLWNMLKDEIDKVINADIIDKDDDVKNAWVSGGKHTLVEVRSYMDRIQSQENISATFFERENKIPITPKDTIFQESVVNGDTLDIPLWYPRNSDIKKIEINLVDVRAADSILIEYDFRRDGWVIKQASKFKWEADEECDSDWQEVAFVQAWAREE